MSLRQSFLTKRYSYFFYFDHGIYCIHTYTYMYIPIRIHVPIRIHMHGAFGLYTVCQSLHEVKTITVTVCQAFIMNSDERGSQTSQKKRASGC